MYKNKWLLVLLVILMVGVSIFIFAACNNNEEPDENDNGNQDPPKELEVPLEDIDSLALKEGSIASIFKVGDLLDLTEAKLLITLKLPEEDEEEGEEEEPGEVVPVVVEIAITEDMIEDFETIEEGFATMRIVYAPEYEVEHEYEVIASTTFFITYELNGGSFEPKYDDEEELIPVPSRFDSIEGLSELEEPIKEHYIFAGWYKDAEFAPNNLVTSLIVGLQNDVELYAKWTAIEYSITFITDYLTVNSITYTADSGIISLPKINADDVEQGDYEEEPASMAFAGWYESETYPANAKRVTINLTDFTPRNFSLYAKWEPKVTVTLNEGFETRYQQGTNSPLLSTAKLTVKDYYGEVINANISVTAAMVSGFDSSVVGANKTLTITYTYGTISYKVETEYEITPNTYYFITYHTNEGELPVDAVDRFETGVGLSELPIPTKTAYDFAGWYSHPTSFTTSNFRDSIAGTVKVAQTLYARWTPTVYDVNYYLNNDTAFDHEDIYNIESTLSLWNAAEREGYHFMGWYDSPDYTGQAISDIAIGNYGDKDFYAKWGAKVTSVTITSPGEFNVKNGQMQLTANVLPDGDDPAIYPEVTYIVVSQVYEGKSYNTGIQVIDIDGQSVIEDGIFIAAEAGYVIVKAYADGVYSETMPIKVVIEEVKEINIVNSPRVAFPGNLTTVELEFEPFTAIPDYNLLTYELIVPDAIKALEEVYGELISLTQDNGVYVADGVPAFTFTVKVTYNSGVNTVIEEKIFNVPQSISSPEELSNIGNNYQSLGGYYVLTGDIDLTGIEWEPIGYVVQAGEQLDYSNSFRGMFFGGKNSEGESFRIKNLTINMDEITSISAGLFGAINNAYLDGIVLEDITIYGTCASNTDYIGGIAGVSRLSNINNSVVTGDINIIGGRYIGGMIGQQFGSMINVKTYIPKEVGDPLGEDKTLSISVDSNLSNLSVGGLVGLFLNGVIDDAEIIADITIINCNSAKIGGLVGDSRDRIINSLATIAINIQESESGSGNAISVGGVVGDTTQSINNVTVDADIIINAKGTVTVGGIAGVATTIDNSEIAFAIDVINSVTTIAGGAAGSASGVLNMIVTINGLDVVATTAKIGGVIGNAFGSIEGDVNVVSLSDISVLATTIYFGGIAGDTIASANGYFNTDAYSVTINAATIAYVGGITGNSTSVVEGVVEVFDYSITAPTTYFGGIIAKTTANAKGEFVANNITITATKEAFVGGIAGYAANITDSIVTVALIDVTGDAYIGGIVGQATHTVSNSNAEITINNVIEIKIKLGYVGGIAGKIGSNVFASINNCEAVVDITAVSKLDGNYFVGGIVGHSFADIIDSVSSGTMDINSNKEESTNGGAIIYAGGIVGQANFIRVSQVNVGSVIGCSAAVDILDIKSVGNTAGNVYAGGLVGQNRGVINTSYATGAIAAFALKIIYTGGLVGANEVVSGSPATITNTYATGAVTIDMSDSGEKGYLGGLVGYNSGTISYSYAKSALEGIASGAAKELNVGGFVGYNTFVIQQSFALNKSGTAVEAVVLDNAIVYVGGFVGANIGVSNKLASIVNAHTNVNVAADGYTGGFSGYNNGFATISYAISLGSVNNTIGGQKVGGFAAKGLTGYSKCFYSTTAAGTSVSKVGEGSVDDTMVQGMTNYALRNQFVYSDAAFNSEIWKIDGSSIPTLIFDSEIWDASPEGPIFAN